MSDLGRPKKAVLELHTCIFQIGQREFFYCKALTFWLEPCNLEFFFVQIGVWSLKNWSLELAKLFFHRCEKILSCLWKFFVASMIIFCQTEEVKWYLPPTPRNRGIGGYVAMYQQITRNYRYLSQKGETKCKQILNGIEIFMKHLGSTFAASKRKTT